MQDAQSDSLRPITLREMVEETFDPGSTVSLFLRLADDWLRRRDIVTWYRPSFHGLKSSRGGTPLMPCYDPTCFEGGVGFWLDCQADGVPIANEAGRLYEIEGSLTEELESLRFYYHPTDRASPGEQCTCLAPAAKRIRGKVWFGGALWVDPDWRGRRIGALLPHICRTLADRLWQQDFTFAVCEDDIAGSPVVSRVGYSQIEPGIEWTGSLSYGPQRLNLMWLSRAELLQDIAGRLALVEAA